MKLNTVYSNFNDKLQVQAQIEPSYTPGINNCGLLYYV